MDYSILLVDDDPLFLESTELLLSGRGYPVESALNAEEALQRIARSPREWALILLDYRLGGVDGHTVVEKIRALTQDPYILVCSGDPSREAVKLSWQAGAVGFIEKGGDPDAFLKDIDGWYRKFLETRAIVDTDTSRRPVSKAIAQCGWIGRSETLSNIAERTLRYRTSAYSVLITGETGTGKELVARGLLAPGKEKDFFAVNCAAYQGGAELLESELFGYEKGAFTGADRDRPGIFELASGGTVFLDEIHHLSQAAQAKLLRVCQEKRLRRVGGTREYAADFRLIAATKPEIEKLVADGKFLPDLYHRINVLRIDIPPLRERPDDIEPLVAHFVRQYQERTGTSHTILLRTLRYLENYAWPGNVRELQNTVERMLTDTREQQVGPEALDRRFFERTSDSADASYAELRERQEEEQRKYVGKILRTSRNKAHAAERLAISPTTLQSMLKRLRLEGESYSLN